MRRLVVSWRELTHAWLSLIASCDQPVETADGAWLAQSEYLNRWQRDDVFRTVELGRLGANRIHDQHFPAEALGAFVTGAFEDRWHAFRVYVQLLICPTCQRTALPFMPLGDHRERERLKLGRNGGRLHPAHPRHRRRLYNLRGGDRGYIVADATGSLVHIWTHEPFTPRPNRSW